MKKLRLAEDLELPVDAVTETFALLAIRGAGKTNTARVLAEEFFAACAPFVVIDPVGVWWGLRAGRDGKPGGLQLPIFGGKHGDLPLERGGGALIADQVVELNLSCVLDLSSFDSEAAKKAFLLDFARRLYQANTTPRHLFLEEADDYVPQRPESDERQLLRAWENIVRRGRSRGLGITLITQRSAVISKNVLTQVGTLIAMRTTSPQDRAAVEAWVEYHDAKREVLESLPGLQNGEAWVWSPHFLAETKRVRFRLSTTFDSGATPKLGAAGAKSKAVATLADVDLGKLRERMAATIERVKAEDPKALQAEVARLKRELAAAHNSVHKNAPKIARVEVPVLKEAQLARLDRLADKAIASAQDLSVAWKDIVTAIGQAARSNTAPSKNGTSPLVRPPARALPTRVGPGTKEPVRPGSEPLGRCERAVIAALAQHGACGFQRLAMRCGYSSSSSSFEKALSNLRTAGLIHGANGASMDLTEAGVDASADVPALPSGRALVDHWLGHSSVGKCERQVLQALLAAPAGLPFDELAAAAEYSPTSSSFEKALSNLRTVGLLVGRNGESMRLCDELLQAAGGAG